MNAETDFVTLVARRWWLPVLTVLIAVGSAACFTSRQTAVYQARNLMVVLPGEKLEAQTEIIRGLDTLDRRSVLATFAKLASTSSVEQRAAARLGLDDEELRRFHIEGKVLPNRNMIEVEVRGPDAGQAADVANAVARITADTARRLYRIYDLEVVEQARPERHSVHPDPMRNYTVAGILGCFVGLLALVVFERRPSAIERS